MSLGLKRLTESLFNSVKNTDVNSSKTYTMRQIDENLVSSYNKMKFIKEQVEDIKSQWKSLQEDIECFSFAKTLYEGNSIRESFQKAIDDLKLEYEDAKSNYLFYKDLKNKVLTEAEEVIVPNDYSSIEDTPFTINNDIKDNEKSSSITTNNNNDDEDYSYIIDELSEMLNEESVEDILQYLFDELVPESGAASTFAGELVRAIMDLLYNARANKYTFYEGDGLTRCGSSAQYLREHGYEDEFTDIINNVYSLDSRTYLEYLISIADKIVRDIYENPEYLTESNSTNSRQYNYSEIEAISPIRDYIVEIPDKITELYDEYFNVYDILRYIKEIFDEDGIYDYIVGDIFDSKAKSISIEDINGSTLDYLKGLFEDSKFWDDYYDELTSDLEEDLQIIHNTLNEDYDNDSTPLVDIFMQYHEDTNNYTNNPSGYDKVYSILDKYGSEDEDVDKLFSMASEDEQKEMIDLIRPKDEYLN